LTIADIQMRVLDEVSKAEFEVWFDDAEKLARERGLSIAFEGIGGWPWMVEFLALRHFVRSSDPDFKAQVDAFRPHRTSL